MENSEKYTTRNTKPKSAATESAGFFSRWLFLWMFPLFRKGNKKDIDLDDLNDVPADNQSDLITRQLQIQWDKQCKKSSLQPGKRPKLLTALLKSFGTRYALFIMIFLFDCCVIRIAQPLLLKQYIKSFNDESISFLQQFLYACGICATVIFHLLMYHPTAFQMCVSGMRCRVAISSIIFRKTLKLSKAAQGQTTVGQVVNLLSNDVSRFDYNLHLIAYVFVGPIQLFLFFYILWLELGLASVAGVAYILLLSPSQFIIGKLSAKFRMEIAEQTDERSRIMSEIIMAIRLIKMYAWEKPFAALITKIRTLEYKALKKRSYLRASYMGVFTTNFTFVPFLAILTYGLLGNDVTPDKAFFAVAIFNAMTECMMYFVPNACACIGELLTSLSRIEDYLLLEELETCGSPKSITNTCDSCKTSNPPRVRINNLTAGWDKDNVTTKDTLNQLTLDVENDKLVMIVGPVGAGKTSLLHVIMEELPIKSGNCITNGTLTYSAQEAWIFPGSIRQNILFAQEYDKQRYSEIIQICALEEDLKQFPYGDMTLVGERGIELSGGQKARLNLARALYTQGTDIYLLDDPLSAVDAAVSRHIFEKCIKKYLAGKLRILVTHQLQYLAQADYVVVLDDGRITAQGTYNELMDQGIDFIRLLATENESEPKSPTKKTRTQSVGDDSETENKQDESAAGGNVKVYEKQEAEDEATAKGSVTAKTYWNYFRAAQSCCGLMFLALGFLFNQFLISSTSYWLCLWTNSEEARLRPVETEATESSFSRRILPPSENDTSSPVFFEEDDNTTTLPPETTTTLIMSSASPNLFNFSEESWFWSKDFYMTIYICLACSVFLVGVIRAIYLFIYTMRISNNIHNRMFASIVNAPVKFFDLNPSGRIMNRFTKDLGALDEYLPLTLFDTLDIGLQMVGILCIVIISNYYLLLPVIVLISVYGYIRQFYVCTARNVKRVEAIARSPLFTHLTSSIYGLTTIRVSKSQKLLVTQFDNLQDSHSSAWFHFIAGNTWFSMWLEITSALFITIVAFGFLGIESSTTSGQVGVAMASLLQLMNIFHFGMRQSAETENSMTSVERTLEYTKIPPEKDTKNSDNPDKPIMAISNTWPSAGSVRFNNVNLTYDGKKQVLKNLSFEIQPREKIGIVGRTGAGKSSIISALFRLSDISGEILIDGCDICEISLELLRKNISIIPQSPVLFSGTIRYNLDPFNMFSDQQLWQVLQEVELKDLFPALDYKVCEEGSNFSVGQRQLVCLARAILRQNRILVLDEATANIDPRTDNLIQQTIRKKFSECTIITIAHRLQSVMDSDRILVMDAGSLQEYSHPYLLLQNPNGYLTKMVQHTGSNSEELLRELAFKAFVEKHGDEEGAAKGGN